MTESYTSFRAEMMLSNGPHTGGGSLARLSGRLVDRREETRTAPAGANPGGPRYDGADDETFAVLVWDVTDTYFTIAVPVDYAAGLEEVRALRLRLEEPLSDLDRADAEARLAAHRYADRALPEDVLASIETTPDPDVSWEEVLLVDGPEGFVAPNGSAEGRGFRFGATIHASLREDVSWAWAVLTHGATGDEGTSFWRAACVESGRCVESDIHELAFSEWFGVRFCAASAEDVRDLARRHPLRVQVLARALERMLNSGGSRTSDAVRSVWRERVEEARRESQAAAVSVLLAAFDRPGFDGASDFAARLLLQSGLAAGFPHQGGVTELNLFVGGLDDRDIEGLVVFPALRRLDLRRNRLTDACLGVLKGLSQLESLRLPDAVSAAGVEQLSRCLPNCSIQRG